MAHEWRTGGIGCFAFSPDGKYVATNDWAGDTVIYEIAPWRALRELPSAARCLAFSPDGSTLAIGSQDHAVHLWNWDHASNWRTWRGHDFVVTDIVWRQDGSHVYSGGMDGRINVWHVHASVPSKPEMRLDRVIGDLPGTGHLLCQNTAAELVIYDPGTEEILSTLPVPPGIAMLRLTEDRRAIHFVAGPETAAPRLVRMALPAGTVERETTLAGPLAPGHRRISADGTRIAVIGEKGIREAWDGLTGQRLHRSTTDRNIPEHASLAAGGSVIWEHGIESGFSAWSWPDWQLLWRKDQLHGKLFSNDATTFIACAQKDGVVTIHSLSDGAKLGTLTGHGTQVYEMDYSPDSTRLVTVCERETRLWALTTMSEVANLGTFRYARTIRFTADGSRLIIHLAGRRPHLLPAK